MLGQGVPELTGEGVAQGIGDVYKRQDGVLQDEPYTRGEPSYPLTPYYGLTIDYPYTCLLYTSRCV